MPGFPKLSRYQVLGRLAVGGMAEVWLARAIGFGGFEKIVVLKTILPNLIENQQFVQMFINEARVAAMLNHPHCVQIFELGKEDNVLFIAMEYIEGFALSRVMKRAKDRGLRLPVEVVSRIACDALSGLEYAHRLTDREGRKVELIHRDVSPDNLLIGFSGQTKLVDFGIAKASMTAMQSTRAGTVKGKFGYIAPEYLRGQKIDGRADLFALGVVLYRALTARRPFVGDSEAAVTLSVLQKSPPTPASISPWVPPEMSGVVMLALEKKPEARFDTARAMRIALERAVRPADADHVAHVLNHLWPPGDPERVALETLAAGQAEERSEPALESIISQGYALPAAALSTPEPAQIDRQFLEQATKAGVVPAVVRVAEAWDEDDEPPPRSRVPWLLAALALAVATAWWQLPHKPQELEALYANAVGHAPLAEAAPPPSPSAAPVPSAAPTPAPAPAAAPAPEPAAPPAPEPEPAAAAQVSVDVTEPVVVFLGTQELGKPPGPFEVPVGPQKLRLVSKALGLEQTFEIDAKPGEVAHIAAMRKGSLTLKVEPWAYVKLDGRSLGQTPIGKQALYEGAHVIELSNTELNINRHIDVKVKSGEAKVVDVNLEE
jgi:serine/threonine-protein kinase